MTKKPATKKPAPTSRLVDLWVVRRGLRIHESQFKTWTAPAPRDHTDPIENVKVAGFVKFDPGAILPADVNPELLPAWESSGLITKVTARI